MSAAAEKLIVMNGDEHLLCGWVYGHDHDDPNPGPRPHQTYAALIGGPLDGLLLDITGWQLEEVDDDVALTTELSRWPGGRALYDPRLGEPRTHGHGVSCRFYYSGDTPDVRWHRCLRAAHRGPAVADHRVVAQRDEATGPQDRRAMAVGFGRSSHGFTISSGLISRSTRG
ncbi:hypothetical protein GCM10010350_74540 [Streptomyces galilaeus]|nr:hypothetical protein GCM10010350_74540 [Streptomyces galilaeus]